MKEAIIQYNDNPDADGGHMVISWKPLVRCNDCKHFRTIGAPKIVGECDLHETKGTGWFCADGERKDEA